MLEPALPLADTDHLTQLTMPVKQRTQTNDEQRFGILTGKNRPDYWCSSGLGEHFAPVLAAAGARCGGRRAPCGAPGPAWSRTARNQGYEALAVTHGCDRCR